MIVAWFRQASAATDCCAVVMQVYNLQSRLIQAAAAPAPGTTLSPDSGREWHGSGPIGAGSGQAAAGSPLVINHLERLLQDNNEALQATREQVRCCMSHTHARALSSS